MAVYKMPSGSKKLHPLRRRWRKRLDEVMGLCQGGPLELRRRPKTPPDPEPLRAAMMAKITEALVTCSIQPQTLRALLQDIIEDCEHAIETSEEIDPESYRGEWD